MYKIILVLDFGDGDPSEVSIKDDNKPEQKLCNFLCDYFYENWDDYVHLQ